MKSGKKFSSRKGAGAGRGRTSVGKKPFGKKSGGPGKFSKGRPKPFAKRDDRDEKPYGDRSKPFSRAGGGKDFKKPFDKKFSPRSGSKPFGKRDDRDEKPYGDRSKSFSRSGGDRDFKKPFDKKYSPRPGSKPYAKRDDRDDKPFSDRSKSFSRSGDRDFKKPFDKKFSPRSGSKPYAKRDDRDEKPYGDRSKSFTRSDDRKDFKKQYDKKSSSRLGSKPFGKRDDHDDKSFDDRSKPFRSEERPSGDRPARSFKKSPDKKFTSERKKSTTRRYDRDGKPFDERAETFFPAEEGNDFVKKSPRPQRKRSDGKVQDEETGKTSERKEKDFSPGDDPKWNRKSGHEFYGDKKKERRSSKKESAESYDREADGSIRLNKYISNSGICSRREADELIAAGVVSVNGEIMTQLGYKVKPGDEVKYNNETLRTERLVYILVNKPKDFITTVDDPQDRKTVMWLIKDACRERVYPVGRLDRNTTGVLLFTNDGDLAKKLTHPSLEVQKIYQVELDAPLKSSDMEQILSGVNLEDGFIKVDDVAYSTMGGNDKSVVGVELHSGRNRIVRRIFEHFGYTVKKLDRVYFAGLSKKDLPRGRWRFLTPLEISNLKMMTGNKKMQKYFEA